ncbi:hypothetical protein F3I16_11920 [Pseudomonas sp. L-22-4S-12]|uniref:cytochrome oxidase putative small subunit CydP n=1 Tax=Pseudomonas sp. L-22-4S-12 TaxID=2610893 RepID=UPI001321D304|nr:cytochrome oxidase putative small subunit CydP [Pseudomonas sp. L-22-4S-12]MWV16748.1 hypothetical protein [Pseudomonas sp. L-22-4S-12]
MKTIQPSIWRIALVREIAAILLIKLALLFAIKAIWFDAPTVPEDGLNRVAHHLLSNAGSPSPSTEETPR